VTRTIRRRNWILAGALLGAASILCGCSGNVRFADIGSKPPGATIYVNGEKVGQTRYQKVRLAFDGTDDRVCIQLVKHRYKPVLQYYRLDEVPENPQMFVLEDD